MLIDIVLPRLNSYNNVTNNGSEEILNLSQNKLIIFGLCCKLTVLFLFI